LRTIRRRKRLDWKPWAKITNSKVFLCSCDTGIKNFNGNMERFPAWHLKGFYMLMKKTAGQPISGEPSSE